MRRARPALFVMMVLAWVGGCHRSEPPLTEAQADTIENGNASRRGAALQRAIDVNHATIVKTTPTEIAVRSDLHRCSAQPDAIVETSDHRRFVAPCEALRNVLYAEAGAIAAKSEDGSESVVLIATGGVLLATGPNGELYLIRPRMKVVRKHTVREEGTCNRMPSPPHLPASAQMWVMPAAVVRNVDAPYDAEEIETVCAEYVY